MRMPTLKRQWTVDDLDDLPDDGQRYEVIDGELFVTPSPSLDHQAAVGALYRVLAGYLEREGVEWRPEGASAPLVIDVERYFAAVLDA